LSTATIRLAKPHAAQRQVLEEAGRFNVLACGRRWGKTVLGANLALTAALEGRPVGWFHPTYKMLGDVWRDVSRRVKALPPEIRTLNVQDKRIELATGGIIEFWSLDSPDGPRGRKYARVIVDEAAMIRELEEAWTAALRPLLTDYQGDAWFMSTPRGMNYFHRLFGKGGEGDWRSWQMPTAANPHMPAEEIEAARGELPADTFSQEFLAEFIADAANPFGIDAIRRCTREDLPDAAGPVAAWGIDLAKSSDWTVAIGLDAEGRVRAFQRWQSDWQNTVKRVAAMIGETPAVVDSTGVGDPIVEQLQQACPQVEGFKFHRGSKQQLMEGLAVGIQQGRIAIPCGRIVTELEMFRYEYHATGVRYEAPAGEHDDCVDALALAWRCLTMGPVAVTIDTGDSSRVPAGSDWWESRVENEDLWHG